jgi:hypothetical protein
LGFIRDRARSQRKWAAGNAKSRRDVEQALSGNYPPNTPPRRRYSWPRREQPTRARSAFRVQPAYRWNSYETGLVRSDGQLDPHLLHVERRLDGAPGSNPLTPQSFLFGFGKAFKKKVRTLSDKGLTDAAIARKLKVGRATVTYCVMAWRKAKAQPSPRCLGDSNSWRG